MIPCPDCDGEGITGTCHREVCGTCGGTGTVTPAEWLAWFSPLEDEIAEEEEDAAD